MSLRSRRDRALQIVCFEFGGAIVAAPVYLVFFGGTATEGIVLFLAVSAICVIWSPLHNTLFDLVEWRRTGRVASRRPHRWRLVHALSHEASSAILTVPVLMWLGGFGFVEALALDLVMTLIDAAWAYAFHYGFDRLRPLAAPSMEVKVGTVAAERKRR